MVDLKMAATCPDFATEKKKMEEEEDQEKKKKNIGKKKSKILRAESIFTLEITYNLIRTHCV